MSDIPPPRREAPQGPAARNAAAGGPRRPGNVVRVSLIWLVPIIALVVTLALAWNAYASRGQLISVSFADATGITPGETTLKFREVTVGKVEAVRFTHDLGRVIVDIRVEPSVAPYVGASATFWVVRPEVTTSGISRLDTVLTGTFIEGDWTAQSSGPRPDLFRGMDRPPLIRSTDEGTWVVLSAPDADSLGEGAPVLFRGLHVGRMENIRLSEDDETVLVDVFIEAPYNRRLTTASVFWDVSGFSLSLGAQGLSVNVNSVATLLQGGASFATLTSGGQPVQPGQIFRLYPDQTSAEEGAFADDEEGQLRVTMLLPDDLRGLSRDADVQLGGVSVGRVTDLAVTVPDSGPHAGDTMQVVTMALSPSRLGLPPGSDADATLAWLDGRVDAGLRARAASGGFLGMSVIIQLVEDKGAVPDSLDHEANPFPRIPAIDSDIQNIAGTAEGFLTRIGSLPLEETLKSAQDMMNSITAIAAAEDTRAIPTATRDVLDQLEGAVSEIRQIATDLHDQETATRLANALDYTADAMGAVRQAADDVPAMIDKIEATADDVRAIDYAALGTSVQALTDGATGLVNDLRAMLGTDDAAELPGNLSDTLKSASALLKDLREGGAIGNLNAMLDSGRAAAVEARSAMAGLPDLTGRLRALTARADGVIASYGDRSAFNSEMLALMREMRRASANFGSLARMIERNPRAFILGR